MEKLKTTTSHLDKFTFEVLPECDHGFYGKEDVLVKTIAEWLAK
jgi:alpha/beta superfamily hydrolase